MSIRAPLVLLLAAPLVACANVDPNGSSALSVSAAECAAASQWAEGVAYTVGTVVGYAGGMYRCAQSHTALSGWTPVVAPALWVPVTCDGGGGTTSGGTSGGASGSCDPNAWVYMGDNPSACEGRVGESCGWTTTNLGQGYHCQSTSWGTGCEPGGATCSGGTSTGGGGTGGTGDGSTGGTSGGTSGTCDPNAWVYMGADPWACEGRLGESCGWTSTNLGQGYHCQMTSWGAGCQPGGTTCPGGTSTGGGTTGGGDSTGGGSTGGDTTLPAQSARLRIVNRCSETIWIAHSTNVPGDQNARLAPNEFHDYAIPDGGLASARFWPKLRCDASGHGCLVGDNGEGGGAPCGPTGCEPPFDSKFEATFAAVGSAAQTWYNLSLVDGYTLPIAVTPHGPGTGTGSCTPSDCSSLTLDACPAEEDLGDGTYVDLRVKDSAGRPIACLSPCKAWNYPAPYGLGRPENQDPGLHMCCPTPFDPASGLCTAANGCMTPDTCRATSDPLSVEHTSYVSLLHSRCPSAYSYAYDDEAGLHACPSTTTFEVTFCP